MNEFEFIKLIKEKRLSKKLSQKELAKLLVIPHTTLCKIENGKQKLDYKTIRMISIILDIDLNLIKEDYCEKEAIYYD